MKNWQRRLENLLRWFEQRPPVHVEYDEPVPYLPVPECGATRSGAGGIVACSLPSGHHGKWHEMRRNDGSLMASWLDRPVGWVDQSYAAIARRAKHERDEVTALQADPAGWARAWDELAELMTATQCNFAELIGLEARTYLENEGADR